MTVGRGASTHRVLDVLGIVVAVLEGAAGIALLCASRHYGSTNGGYAVAALLILVVAVLTGLPVRVYRNKAVRALGAMSGAFAVVIGLFGVLYTFSFWEELAEHGASHGAPLMLLAGGIIVCSAGAIPFTKSGGWRVE